MATRSTIWIENEDGSRDGIYCHHDGYPDYVGMILKNNYDTDEKIRELISLGGISSLAPTVEETAPQSYYILNHIKNKISFHISKLADIRQHFEEYNYIWREGFWWIAKENSVWIPLDQVIMEAKKEEFYPELNEIYSDLSFINVDDSCPPYLKKQFRSFARMIYMELSDEKFSDAEIEDYLIELVQRALESI